MRDRIFGKTYRLLSIFSLGTMRFESAAVADAVITAAIAQGINHIETAPAYGQSERYVGKALERILAVGAASRDQLTVTSKIAPTTQKEDVEAAVRASLSRLGIDYLDCLAIHGINTQTHLDAVQAEMLAAIASLTGQRHRPPSGIFDSRATSSYSECDCYERL